MKTASVSEIREELKRKPSNELIELCLKLARYKLENKELLTFLLFESDNIESYIKSVKVIIDENFKQIHSATFYQAKKGIRKVLRLANKYIKYSSDKLVEAELLIYFCTCMKDSGFRIRKSNTMQKLYERVYNKINISVLALHSDLQRDLLNEIERLDLQSF